MTEGKQKLTLSVDAESVEKAKALGINISDLTEQVLRSFTLRPEDTREDALKEQRELLFKEMTPLLKGLSADVRVGSIYDPGAGSPDDESDVVLTGDGKVMVVREEQDEDGSYSYYTDPSEVGGLLGPPSRVSFLPPDKIVRNFMEAVEAAKSKRKEEIASFALARKIVEAVTQVDKATSRAGPPTRTVDSAPPRPAKGRSRSKKTKQSRQGGAA